MLEAIFKMKLIRYYIVRIYNLYINHRTILSAY